MLSCNRMQLRPENAEHVATASLWRHLLDSMQNCRGSRQARWRIQLLFPHLQVLQVPGISTSTLNSSLSYTQLYNMLNF